jgi:hypothetical protein
MQLPDVQLPGCRSTAAAFHWLPGVALMPSTKTSSFDLSWTLIPPPVEYGSLLEFGNVNVVSTYRYCTRGAPTAAPACSALKIFGLAVAALADDAPNVNTGAAMAITATSPITSLLTVYIPRNSLFTFTGHERARIRIAIPKVW